MSTQKKLVVISSAGLGSAFAADQGVQSIAGLRLRAMKGAFPAVTCTAQAGFRTGTVPAEHGMVANGLFDKRFCQVRFWEQAASQVEGERIWSRFRQAGGRVGILFWQQSMGESVDMYLSPAPIHTHAGKMIMDCACEPAGLYAELRQVLGAFPLHRYWGPLASASVGDWIAKATVKVMSRPDAPDLLLVYLPTMDYDLQRYGPESPQAEKAVNRFLHQATSILEAAPTHGYQRLLFGDYAITAVKGDAIFPNRVLAETGSLKTRRVRNMLYPDFANSTAFAVVDHEVAHVHLNDPSAASEVQRSLSGIEGVESVLSHEAMQKRGVAHEAAGDLLMIAKSGRWFAYPWWSNRREAPDYATHIDIHRKPGFDPCEMFFSLWPPGVSQKTARIRGTHGRAGRDVAWCSDLSDWDNLPKTLAQLGRAVGDWLVGA